MKASKLIFAFIILMVLLYSGDIYVYGQVPDIGEGMCIGNCDDGWSPPPEIDRGDVSAEPTKKELAIEAYNKGLKLKKQGRYSEAEAACREAIRLNPSYGRAYNNLGTILYELGRYEEALAMFRRAIKLGGSEYAKENLHNLETWLARKREEENRWQVYLRAKENQRQADELVEQGDYESAIILLRENIRIYPGAYAHNNLGSVLFEQGRNLEAAEEFRKAIALDSTYSVARENLEAVNKEIKRSEEFKKIEARIPIILDELEKSLDESSSVKGARDSSAVDLSFMDPNQPLVVEPEKMQEGLPEQKGLKIKELSKPDSLKPKWDPYSADTTTEIVLDALQIGKGDWEKSINHLENYLIRKNPNNVKVKEALSYIEGLHAGTGGEEIKAKSKNLFAPSQDDSKWLIEAVVGNVKQQWPGAKNPEPFAAGVNPLDWKVQRAQMVLDALEQGKGDWQRSISYLEQLSKQKDSKKSYTARQALNYLEGFYAYYQKLKESK